MHARQNFKNAVAISNNVIIASVAFLLDEEEQEQRKNDQHVLFEQGHGYYAETLMEPFTP